MSPQLHRRAAAIERAASMVGGVTPLAQRLNVTESELLYWMRELATPPDTVFFDVIDVIIETAGSAAAEPERVSLR